eukprot:scaffold156355_cov36-Tisochrysis_lutea.AAC.2
MDVAADTLHRVLCCGGAGGRDRVTRLQSRLNDRNGGWVQASCWRQDAWEDGPRNPPCARLVIWEPRFIEEAVRNSRATTSSPCDAGRARPRW